MRTIRPKYLWMLVVFLLIIIIGLSVFIMFNDDYMWVNGDILSQKIISPNTFNLTEDSLTINFNNITFFNITKGISMLPAIHDNSTQLYIILGNNSLYMGDVVRFKYEEYSYMHHRIIDIRNDEEGIYYITRGDNNLLNDDLRVRRENITHKLIGILY